MTPLHTVALLITPAFPSEIVEPNAAQTLVAIATVSLFLAVASATVLGVVRATRLTLAAQWCWLFFGVWGVSTLCTAVAATSTSGWGVTIAATVSLPLLLLLSRTDAVRAFLGNSATHKVDLHQDMTHTRTEQAAVTNRKDQK
jgi:hypothetical protein